MLIRCALRRTPASYLADEAFLGGVLLACGLAAVLVHLALVGAWVPELGLDLLAP